MNKKFFKLVSLVLIFSLMMGTTVCAKGNGADTIINSAELTPATIGSQPLESELNRVFGQILTDNMTSYDKVKACYDWLIVNTEYGFSYMEEEDYNLNFTTYSDRLAYMVLKNHVGDCIGYSITLKKMMRSIGVNCYVQYGLTHRADGGYSTHAWLVAAIDGKEYVFDPQLDDNLAKGSEIGYYRFCKTYDAVAGKYVTGEAAAQYANEAGFADFYNMWIVGVKEQEDRAL